MYVVHTHNVRQKYKTHICSRATLFQFFVIILTFIPPLIIAYVTHGKQIFWLFFRFLFNTVLLQALNFLVINCKPHESLWNTAGFWLKESSFREQPDVRFKHELLVVLQGNTPGSFMAYSTFQNFNHLLQGKLRIPLIKVIRTESEILVFYCDCEP